MKFAVSYNTGFLGIDPDAIVAYAQRAEQCGFEGLYVPEHVVLYPGAALGAFEIPPALPIADPLELLAFVAGTTERLLLGTGVLLLPYHHPVTLAKRLATVDALSKGRMRLLTVGVGALPGEAAAVGVEYKTRGKRADEAIDALRLLWSGGDEGVSYHGNFFSFENLVSYPKPYQATELPIHVGGSSMAAARRAGARGAGYFPGGALTDTQRDAQLHAAREAAVTAGRDPQALEYTRWGSPDLSEAQVAKLAAQGVTRIVISANSADDLPAIAERFGLM